MKKALFILIAHLIAFGSFASEDIIGKWKLIDNKTGKVMTVVEISIRNEKLYGKVVEVETEADTSKTCTLCTDYRKNRKILGMYIISGLRKKGNVWEGSNAILNPEDGKTYDCKIWVENGTLKVRGYVKFLFKTITWFRA